MVLLPAAGLSERVASCVAACPRQSTCHSNGSSKALASCPDVLRRAGPQSTSRPGQQLSTTWQRLARQCRATARPPARLSVVSHSGFTGLSEAYNKQMAQQMAWDNPYEYHYDRGLYYHEIVPNLICGSQPRNTEDLSHLGQLENVNTILNLQQDKDLAYWNVDLGSLQHRARELGVNLVRRPARDFDPNSLRSTLPNSVATLDAALREGHRVYVHCTAGLGRAPAVCIAWLYWFGGMQLDEAYRHLTDIRPCGPKRDAIRGATYDIMTRSSDWHRFDHLPQDAWAFLSDSDRETIHRRVRRLHDPHHHHHHHHH